VKIIKLIKKIIKGVITMVFDVKKLRDESISANHVLSNNKHIQEEMERFNVNKEKSDIKKSNTKKHTDSKILLEKFKISTSSQPIYKKINNFNDINKLISEIILEIEKININSYIIGVKDENTKKSLELMNKIIEKYKTKIKDIENIENTEDLKTVRDIQNLFRDKILKNTEKFFLKKVIDSIYKGLFANMEYDVYESILKKVNKYLSYLGITTYNNININEEINDLNYVEILTTKDTSDKNMVGKVSEIISYPYIINDNKDIIVYEGIVILYKKNGE